MTYKKIAIITLLLFIIQFLLIPQDVSATNYLDSIFTTLVITEEQENGRIVSEATPFTNGVYDAFWDSKYIFFDMKISEPLAMVYNQLDIKPYITTARESGADSLLLIQFHYTITKEGASYHIMADEVVFHLYSISLMKSIRVGRHKVNMDMNINTRQKLHMLRQIGYDTLLGIYK